MTEIASPPLPDEGLITALIGGLTGDEIGIRTVRGALLVMVPTWMRLAAGSAGLREAFRRFLLRAPVPGSREAGTILSELDSGPLLASSAGALRERLRGVEHSPVPLANAIIAWAAAEAKSAPVHEPTAIALLRLRATDAMLAVSVLLPAGALPAVVGG